MEQFRLLAVRAEPMHAKRSRLTRSAICAADVRELARAGVTPRRVWAAIARLYCKILGPLADRLGCRFCSRVTRATLAPFDRQLESLLVALIASSLFAL